MHASLALKAELFLEHNMRVRIKIFDNVTLEPEDIWNIHNHKKLLLNRRHTVLLIAGEYASITKEALAAAAETQISGNKIAEAIVINSLAQRIIANFFIRIHKPVTHTRVFNKAEEARQWLDGIEKELLPDSADQ